MLKRLKNLLFVFRKPKVEDVDTTPAHFNVWLQSQIGKKLQGGDSYYTIGIVGQKSIPRIGDNFFLFGKLEEADSRRSSLQRENRSIKLEVRVIRMFYSVER